MSFEPELTTCPKCQRRGCWDGVTTINRKANVWTCKCGQVFIEERPEERMPLQKIKLDFEQRQRASLLEEWVLGNPEKAAEELIYLRDLLGQGYEKWPKKDTP